MYWIQPQTMASPRYGYRNEIAIPSSGILVRPSFFGLNTQDWPVRAGTSGGNAPTFPVGSLASWDSAQLHWRYLHTAANTINWSTVDTFVSQARAAGISEGTYVLYGCPTFLASSGAGVAGPFGGLGEGAYPNDLSQLEYFCRQFVSRNASSWGSFFKEIQLFNEPELGGFGAAPSASAFVWMTATQFVDMLWTAYAAFKTADPTLKIMSSGTFKLSGANSLSVWASTAGTVFPAKTGSDCFDAMALHPYHARPNGYYGMQGDILSLDAGGLLKLRTVLKPLGKWPIECHVTEYGVSSGSDAELTEFNAATAEFRRLFAFRLDMSMACNGIKKNNIFSLGNVANLCNNLDIVTLGGLPPDTLGYKLGRAQAYAAMVNKTIVAAGWYADGRQEINWSDGTVLTV